MHHWKLIVLASVIMHSIWVKCAQIEENILHEIEEELSPESCETLIKLIENCTNIKLQIHSDSILVGPVVKSFNCSASLYLWNEVLAIKDDDAILILEELFNAINRSDLKRLLHRENKSSDSFVDFVDDTIQHDDLKSNNGGLNWNFPSFENGLNYRYVAIILLLIVVIVVQTYKMSVVAQRPAQAPGNPMCTQYVHPYDCDVENNQTILEKKYSDSDSDDDEETTIHFVRTTSRQRYQVKDIEPLLHH